jgi:UDP-N-acetylmuramoyl-tripeptide--D-alanyl-D-alanine ligase
MRFPGVSIDSRTIRPKEIFLAIRGQNFDGHDFIPQALDRGAAGVIFSDPGKASFLKKDVGGIQVPNTVMALGALARYHRKRFDIPVIAITGSSGKTTTKEMMAWVLGAKYQVHKNHGTQNNLVGVPLTLLSIHSKHDICVVEMGTNRKGEIHRLTQIAQPNVGVITNIGPAHLEFLENLKGVYKEKTELIRNLVTPGIALLNKSDIALARLSRIKTQPVFFYGINRDCEFNATEINFKVDGITFMLNNAHVMEIKHTALHNVSNAMAAIGCGLLFGLDIGTIRERIRTFDSPDMRLKEIRLKEYILIDDSYNSNPQSLKQAIDMLCRYSQAGGRRILVMGDMMELGDKSQEFHAYFGNYISKKPIDLLITMGSFSKWTSESARKNGMRPEAIYHGEDCPQVLEFLCAQVKAGDILLIKGSRSMKMERIVAHFKELG